VCSIWKIKSFNWFKRCYHIQLLSLIDDIFNWCYLSGGCSIDIKYRDYFNYRTNVQKLQSLAPKHESRPWVSYRLMHFTFRARRWSIVECRSFRWVGTRVGPVGMSREAGWLIGLTWIIRIGRINCRIKYQMEWPTDAHRSL